MRERVIDGLRRRGSTDACGVHRSSSAVAARGGRSTTTSDGAEPDRLPSASAATESAEGSVPSDRGGLSGAPVSTRRACASASASSGADESGIVACAKRTAPAAAEEQQGDESGEHFAFDRRLMTFQVEHFLDGMTQLKFLFLFISLGPPMTS